MALIAGESGGAGDIGGMAPVLDINPDDFLFGLRSLFERHGLGEMSVETAPGGDRIVDLTFDRDSLTEFFNSHRSILERTIQQQEGLDAAQANERASQMMAQFGSELEAFCATAPVTIHNPLGEMERRLSQSIAGLFGMRAEGGPAGDERFGEAAQRESAAEAGRPYIAEMAIDCRP